MIIEEELAPRRDQRVGPVLVEIVAAALDTARVEIEARVEPEAPEARAEVERTLRILDNTIERIAAEGRTLDVPAAAPSNSRSNFVPKSCDRSV